MSNDIRKELKMVENDPLGYQCEIMYRYLKSTKKIDDTYYDVYFNYLDKCDPNFMSEIIKKGILGIS